MFYMLMLPLNLKFHYTKNTKAKIKVVITILIIVDLTTFCIKNSLLFFIVAHFCLFHIKFNNRYNFIKWQKLY
ncbi:MAG: hypothetical protein WJU30_00163 [Candidatus Phytoplasma pruni]